jgi:hypothetical protein
MRMTCPQCRTALLSKASLPARAWEHVVDLLGAGLFWALCLVLPLSIWVLFLWKTLTLRSLSDDDRYAFLALLLIFVLAPAGYVFGRSGNQQ